MMIEVSSIIAPPVRNDEYDDDPPLLKEEVEVAIAHSPPLDSTSTSPSFSHRFKFKDAQKNRTLIHPSLPQPTPQQELQNLNEIHSNTATTNVNTSHHVYPLTNEKEQQHHMNPYTNSIEQFDVQQNTESQPPSMTTERPSELKSHSAHHSFVCVADSQLGMTSLNNEWLTELQYCQEAVDKINCLDPLPKFVCMCGDIVDMEQSFYYNNPAALRHFDTLQECHDIQDKQNADFQHVFSKLHPDIALVCLCGNHDVGNRPTQASIQRFRNAFGDEYLAFWVNGTYNICLNNVLFTDPSGAPEMYQDQLKWLEERLIYATDHAAFQIYVFGHHPWFLYNDKEDVDDFFQNHGSSFPPEWDDGSGKFDGKIFPDVYFSVPKAYRIKAMELFEQYQVAACFSGHFHQNLVSTSSFGMEMIVTGGLSVIFDSTGKPTQKETNGRGIRIVDVFTDLNSSPKACASDCTKPNCNPGGFRRDRARFSHRFECL